MQVSSAPFCNIWRVWRAKDYARPESRSLTTVKKCKLMASRGAGGFACAGQVARPARCRKAKAVITRPANLMPFRAVGET